MCSPGGSVAGRSGGLMRILDKRVELSCGPIRYRDTGTGEPIVFVHGLLVDGQLWRDVAPLLERDFRVIVPGWPLRSRPEPAAPGADLSPPRPAPAGPGFPRAPRAGRAP